MKILVFSDSHRSRGGMLDAIDAHRPDQVIHLGDLQSDAEELTYVYPKLPICMVPGNCDGWTMDPLKKQITLAGKRILLSHGHLWGVKKGYEAAVADGNAFVDDLRALAAGRKAGFACICAKLEEELQGLPEEEQAEMLTSYGIEESGLVRIIRTGYATLGLCSYFTAGPDEVRAWTIHQGWKAPQAAGVIHTDFERGFIRAEVISFEDYMSHESEAACRADGVLRVEGKDYVVRDGDVMHFLFNV